MKTIQLNKENHPISVIRKTLYWLKEENEWLLNEDKINWLIIIKNEENFDEIYFYKLLNDNLLRFEIDKNTLKIREKIIHKALSKVYDKI